jgi:CubicO group peptidase (beta-lactamase class C family)
MASLRPLRRVLALGLLLVATAPATGLRAAEIPPVPTTLEDPGMAARLASVPKVSPWPDAWFVPREVVRGASRPHGLPRVRARSIDAAALERASSYAREQNALALLVWRAGRLEFAQFKDGFDERTPFNSYHMHWLPLVLATGAAVRDGAIASIDDPLSKYLVEWRDDPRGRIRVRDLLNMSAGLAMYSDSSNPAHLATHVFFGTQRERAILQWPRESEPGRSYEYNYVIPELLGLVLERATGRRYADYLSDRLWRPLRNGDAQVWLDRPGGSAYHNAALFAAPRDWLHLGILLADRGRFEGRSVLPADWIRDIATPSAANPNFGFLPLGSPWLRERRLSPRVNYFSLVGEPLARDDVLIVDGYVNRLFAVPSERLVVLFVGTPGRVTGARRATWDDAALLNPILNGLGPLRP